MMNLRNLIAISCLLIAVCSGSMFLDAPCWKKVFGDIRKECLGLKDSADRDKYGLCIFEKMEMISSDGEIILGKLIQRFDPYVIDRPKMDEYIAWARVCADEVGRGQSKIAAFRRFKQCDILKTSYLVASVCREDEVSMFPPPFNSTDNDVD